MSYWGNPNNVIFRTFGTPRAVPGPGMRATSEDVAATKKYQRQQEINQKRAITRARNVLRGYLVRLELNRWRAATGRPLVPLSRKHLKMAKLYKPPIA